LAGLWLCETEAMTRDEAAADDVGAAVKVSALFDPAPHNWGLRGDPWLWRDLCEHLAGQDIPASASELTGLLHAAFRDLTGIDLAADPASMAYRERYTHGGLSSGMISLDTWRARLMPMLAERAGPWQHERRHLRLRSRTP
jgi:hypothetical protein